MFDHQSVKLVAMTQPKLFAEGSKHEITADEFIAYTARVSNPANQNNTQTAGKLLSYMIRNEHWSPFEMVHVVMEIKTTRDIGRQILRHRSFSFQEFSQRYAQAVDFAPYREARLQDKKNRQNSTETSDEDLKEWWEEEQANLSLQAKHTYKTALEKGIAKEQARAILPEGLTMSTMYMAGTLRSWLHYCKLRCANGTQKEHQDIALKARAILIEQFPSCEEYLLEDERLNDLIRQTCIEEEQNNNEAGTKGG